MSLKLLIFNVIYEETQHKNYHKKIFIGKNKLHKS